MKKAIILVNAYADIGAITHQVQRLKEEFKILGVETQTVKSNGYGVYIGQDGKIINNLKGDFCVYLDKDPYISWLLEKSGMRVFNSHKAVFLCDDKMKTHAYLAGNGVKMPETLSAPLCYSEGAEIPEAEIERIGEALGYPLIVKTCYGSRGTGVYKADNPEELKELKKRFIHTPHLYQKFIKESAGRDIRAIAVGGKVIACMERKSEADFRSNIELGGKGTAFTPDDELKALCTKVSDILGLDYCGIDILPSDKGYLVCEVNSNAFFKGIESVTGVNVARAYCRHIFDKVY